METCANCGATIRPGARFCTTCGTRVHVTSTDDGGWGAAAKAENTDDQQTSVLEPIKLPDPAPKTPTTPDNDRWATGWGTPQPATDASDPASRFITALDDEVKPTTEDSGWAAPADNSWNFSSQTNNWGTWGASQIAAEESQEEIPAAESEASAEDENTATDAITESTIEINETTHAEDTTEQENVTSETETDATDIPDGDPRHRIVELLSELQTLVPQITPIDGGSAAMTLTEASLKAHDFGDLQDVIAQVKEDPRDIKALSDLAEKIDRIDALVQAHTALSDAVESALHDLGSK